LKKIRIRKIKCLSLSIGNKRYKPLKQKEMIGKKNSGKFQQDAVVGRFARDARGTQNSVAVGVALKQGQAKAEYAAKQQAPTRVSYKFLATGK
jgi:hypothetical protein